MHAHVEMWYDTIVTFLLYIQHLEITLEVSVNFVSRAISCLGFHLRVHAMCYWRGCLTGGVSFTYTCYLYKYIFQLCIFGLFLVGGGMVEAKVAA